MTDQNIVITGAGKGTTTITTTNGFAYITASGSNVPTWRITAMTFTGTGSQVVIQVWGTGSGTMRGWFRIDNVDLNYPTSGSDGMIQVWGPLYGLIDHSDFEMQLEAAILTSLELDTENCSFNVGGPCTLSTLQGGAGLVIPYSVGGPINLYIEDCTFTAAGGGDNYFAALDTAYGGARIVFRYNTANNVMLYSHWTGHGSVNTLWWEIYNNTFVWTGSNFGLYPMRLQGGGTGIIHDNTITGWYANYILVGDGRLTDQGQSGVPLNYCDGTQTVDGNAGDSGAAGWPCLAQIGRDTGPTIAQIQAGTKQGTFPLYLWNNGPEAKCSNTSAGGSACSNTFTLSATASASAPNYIKTTAHSTSGFGNGDVDWNKSASQPSGAGNHTLTYTPYTYPYPTGDSTTGASGRMRHIR